jgi:hypothetical protein
MRPGQIITIVPPEEKRFGQLGAAPCKRRGGSVDEESRATGLYRNAISYFGGLIILISLALIVLFLLLSFGLKAPSPYIGIFTYMIFPVFLALGVLIFLLGMIREVRRRRRLGAAQAPPYPKLDLNEPRQRKRFTMALLGACLILILLAFVGYNAYLFTDSNTFCGRLCHSVMRPEYTAYLNGPHARVRCVECHVGSGVSWYVKSKVSGMPQVLAVLFRTYSRPIPVPLTNLRPARETCEECHWPEKFYGAQLMQNPYFRYNEKNSPEQISLLIRTGGGTPNLGENAGIHWHMAIGNRVEFRATGADLQEIPWMRVVSPDGTVMIYKDKESKLSDQGLEKLPVHYMDCMDCHNRPSHVFLPPETAVDQAMAGRNISPQLPWIKKVAMDVLVREYSDAAQAAHQIRQLIESYYAQNFPDVLKKKKAEVDQAAATLVTIYNRNVFPEMRVNWTTYPNNIGHRNWPGCFRCHGSRHVNQQGKALTSDCPICHTIPQRGPLLALGATTPTSTEPWHPWPLEGEHARILCNLCHKAGYRPPLDCVSCHRINTSAPMMSMPCKTCHLREAEVKPMKECRSCHARPGGLHHHEAHSTPACTECHTPHVWTVSKRETCLTCHDQMKNHYAPQFCEKCHDFRAKEKKTGEGVPKNRELKQQRK